MDNLSRGLLSYARASAKTDLAVCRKVTAQQKLINIFGSFFVGM
jgi:hypothetical protein